VNWMDEANCKGMDVDIFFPLRGEYPESEKIIKVVCGNCKVKNQCLEYGMNQEVGYFGGVSAIARIRIVRARRRKGTALKGVTR
jgi:Transcription factor WhiB